MWTTPKTNWHGERNEENVYTGDRFNATDFNRIKNNLVYLRDLSIKLYETYSIISVGDDRDVHDYFYADEINNLESNLNTINSNTLNLSYGAAPTYEENGATMTFKELNRLESSILDLYNRLSNEYDGRRVLTWNFGMKGGL